MAILRERTDLDKKPTWYLFLISNVIILIGCAVTFALFYNNQPDSPVLFVPSIVCDLVALLLCGFFVWLEAKGIMNKAMHFRRKWLGWYLAALIVFIVAIIFSFIFIVIFRTAYYDQHSSLHSQKWPLIIYIVITGVLTLVSIGLQRYARFKIDLDIYKRTHGELPKKEELDKEQAKQEKKEAKQKDKASSGLADSIDKQ